MRLSRTTVGWLIGMTVAALAGLLVLQYRLLLRSIDLHDQTFRRNAYAALNAATERIEEEDVRNLLFVAGRDSIPFAMRFVQKNTDVNTRRGDSSFTMTVTTSALGSTSIEGNRLSYRLPSTQRVSVKAFDTFGRLDTVILDEIRGKGVHQLSLPHERWAGGTYFLQVRLDSASSLYRWEFRKGITSFESSVGPPERQGRIIRRVSDAVSAARSRPLADRIRGESIDSLLGQSLRMSGIPLRFGFEVRDILADSVIAGRTVPGESGRDPMFVIPVFSHDFSGTPGEVSVWFPDYQAHQWAEVLPEFGLNALFVAIVLGCFWYTIRTILRQRDFAASVTDFINNMTHEFKTPLSTIALASEALEKPDIVRVRSRVSKYNRIIAEENARMRTQVEKILHLAALEEGEYPFRREPVDLHAIILKSLSAVQLQISGRKGKLATGLNAQRSSVLGDTVHLENVVRNVLDNAEKYSPGAPDLFVETENRASDLVVRISDCGVGMSKEQAARAFEKFYRVPTGNLHDVKGFGIGLSYVRLVVKAHGGSVRIFSEPGRGTTVEIALPVPQS